jgi:hypothetical protein
MPHPDEGLIHAWLDGELDAAEAARVEALVASDPAWAAAAADARGLIAASARIVGSLDRVPANVIPAAPPAPARAPRRNPRWMLRAAAAVVLIGGSAVVLNRSSVDTVTVTIPVKEPPKEPPKEQENAQPNTPAAMPVTPPANALQSQKKKGSDSKSTIPKQELSIAKQPEPLRDRDAASNVAESRARQADAARAAPASAPAPARVAGAAVATVQVQSFATEKSAVQAVRCFLQRAPADSALRIIRLDAAALADSIRLEKLTLRSDTLAAVNGKLIAVPVRCPAP